MTARARLSIWLSGFSLSLVFWSALGQSFIAVDPLSGDVGAETFGEVQRLTAFHVSASSGPAAPVKFKVDRVVSRENEPVAFLILSPSSGSTPARIKVGPNPNVTRHMRPGRYVAWVYLTTVDQSPPATAFFIVSLTLNGPPPPAVGAVVNTASLQPGISPGGLISIFGENLGPPVLSAEYDSEGLYPTTFGNTTVTINDIAAPLLYVSPSRIDAVVPYAISGQESVRIVVSRYGEQSPAFEAPAVDLSPAIFTADSSGTGPGDILNYSSTNYGPNSADNPAEPGWMIVLHATGTGVLNAAIPEASISVSAETGAAPSPIFARPVSLTIGGLPARVIYAGAASYQSVGKLQINARIPEGVPSGPQPVVLTIGSANNEQQRVTIAIK